MSKQRNIWEKYYVHSTLITFLLMLFYFFWIQNSFFYTSVLDYKWVSSDIFDGTVYPIEFVPNPLTLSYEQRKQNYDSIDSKYFIKTPIYSPNIFQKDLDSYKVWSEDYSQIITQRLIFSVPYLWTYNYDFKEFTWSHPWVDIIAPEWTPVRNIASWLVVDVWYQAWGFWNYVLVKHSGVTLPSWKTWNIYSLYAHLSKSLVSVWTKIKKAEIIWLVWKSWTATTAHLHFQIDIDWAPFNPYWPFSSADMKAAWVWFFDGINIWLGKENAILYTINPLDFVNKNISTVLYTSSPETKTTPEVVVEENTQVVQQDEVSENSEQQKEQEVETTQEIVQNNEEPEVQETQTSQQILKESIIKKDIELLSALNAEDILNGEVQVAIVWDENTIALLTENNLEELSDSFDKITQMENDILTEDNSLDLVQQEVPENTTTEQLEEKIADDRVFWDVENDYKYLNELKYFKDKNIISWFSDNTFRPNNNITRVEALKVMLLANNISPVKDSKSLFNDINTNSWENTYINAWVNEWIISTENKLFYPFRNVSRVEALKIILTLWKIDFSNLEKDLTFTDVSEEDWYYDYVNYAVKNNLFENIELGDTFSPGKALTREELISILYKYIQK